MFEVLLQTCLPCGAAKPKPRMIWVVANSSSLLVRRRSYVCSVEGSVSFAKARQSRHAALRTDQRLRSQDYS